MSKEEEDKPTVVLDFNSLKEELEQSEELTDKSLDLKFNVDLSDVDPLEDEEQGVSEEDVYQKHIYLFEYKSQFFEKVLLHHLNSASMQLISTLDQLNTALTDHPNSIVVFYYNAQPKAVNQLSLQIKTKFPQASTLIVAKNLSADKAQKHSQTKYGANAYLNHPFDINQFYKTIFSLEEE